jgi:hypothetical protein
LPSRSNLIKNTLIISSLGFDFSTIQENNSSEFGGTTIKGRMFAYLLQGGKDRPWLGYSGTNL